MIKRRPAYSRGHWAVTRERHQIGAAVPSPSVRDGVPIAPIIAQVIKRLGLESQHGVACVSEAWTAVAGDAVARHTRPGRLDNGHLVVYVDSSMWLSELSRYGRQVMLERLQKRFGRDRIRIVSLQLDPDGPRPRT